MYEGDQWMILRRCLVCNIEWLEKLSLDCCWLEQQHLPHHQQDHIPQISWCSRNESAFRKRLETRVGLDRVLPPAFLPICRLTSRRVTQVVSGPNRQWQEMERREEQVLRDEDGDGARVRDEGERLFFFPSSGFTFWTLAFSSSFLPTSRLHSWEPRALSIHHPSLLSSDSLVSMTVSLGIFSQLSSRSSSAPWNEWTYLVFPPAVSRELDFRIWFRCSQWQCMTNSSVVSDNFSCWPPSIFAFWILTTTESDFRCWSWVEGIFIEHYMAINKIKRWKTVQR